MPLGAFDIVCCAVATVSAAVGYRISSRRYNAQRRSSSHQQLSRFHSREVSVYTASTPDDATISDASDISTSSDCTEDTITVEETCTVNLKRKTRDEDEFNHAADGRHKDETTLHAPPGPASKRICRTPSTYHDHNLEQDNTGESRSVFEPIALGVAETDQTTLEKQGVSPALVIGNTKSLSSVPTLSTPFPSPFTVIRAAGPSAAFSSFAGNTSPFGLASTSTSSLSKPVWCATPLATNPTHMDVPLGRWSDQQSQSVTRDDAIAHASQEAGEHVLGVENPLVACAYAKSTHITVTGEEDEDVKAELKGAKVFIKRGDKDFSDGILGHVKLLSHRDTADERLLFRREPVWKVSMSVRLRPAVHCTFDEDQGILRVVLKEPEEQEDVPVEKRKQQIVVYALKRGKASKADFAEFAREVVASSWLATPIPSQIA